MSFVYHGKKPGRKPKPFEHYTRRNGDCLIWTGAINSSGYGSFREPGCKPRKAHHVAYEHANGPLPVSGSGHQAFVVMHTCDNRLCVEPQHLVLTTQKQNIHDAIHKGRVPHISGAKFRPVRQKFDRDEARAYRKQGATLRDLAAFFGVRTESVWKALAGG